MVLFFNRFPSLNLKSVDKILQLTLAIMDVKGLTIYFYFKQILLFYYKLFPILKIKRNDTKGPKLYVCYEWISVISVWSVMEECSSVTMCTFCVYHLICFDQT